MSIPPRIRRALQVRAEGRCEICGLFGANNAHHRRNRSQGGKDVLSNLMLLCGSGTTECHGFVTENPREAYSNGWSIRGWMQSPSQRPVLRRGVWVLLDDSGGFERVPTPTQWERFTGFLPSAGMVWRRQLPGDRLNAWVTRIDQEIEAYRWSVEDNTCGRTLDSGYADSLEEACALADAAALAQETA